MDATITACCSPSMRTCGAPRFRSGILDEMSITDKDRSLGTVEVIQFSRTRADRGMFGHFDPGRNIIDWNLTVDQVDPQLVNAVNASKVAISGAILVRHGVTDCETQQWKVVTESTDSSNILVYGPSDR